MDLRQIVRLALEEDLGTGDITTGAFDATATGKAELKAKEPCIVCGADAVREVFAQIDPMVDVTVRLRDGEQTEKGGVIATVAGSIGSILKGERVALNFIQRLSGIATMTAQYAGLLQHARVYDTRKTTPLLRGLEKAAVRAGGGENHRMGLYDAILIKDNHVAMAGSVTAALRAVQEKQPGLPREIEVRNASELREALAEHAEVLLLDNMTPEQVKACLAIIDGMDYEPEVEVSGGIDLTNIARYDLPGVHRISVGGLTHSVRSIDMNLKIVG